jgi:GntR family transcriptional regulator
MNNPQYNQVASQLRQAIFEGKHAPGTSLPPERALCMRYKVSRITIRQALALLEEERLIIRRQGSGTYVRQNPTRRIPLKVDYTGSIREHAPHLTRELLSSCVMSAREWVADELGVVPATPVLYAERLDRNDATSVAWDEVYIPETYASQLTAEILARVDFLESWCAAQGLKPKVCRQQVQAVTANAADQKLLNLPVGSPLLRTIDLYEAGNGRPIGLFVSHYHPEYITISSHHFFAQ